MKHWKLDGLNGVIREKKKKKKREKRDKRAQEAWQRLLKKKKISHSPFTVSFDNARRVSANEISQGWKIEEERIQRGRKNEG